MRRWHLESRLHLKTMRGEGWAARGREKEEVCHEYERRREMRMWHDMRRHNNHPGQSRGEREADTQVVGQEAEEKDGGGGGGGLP